MFARRVIARRNRYVLYPSRARGVDRKRRALFLRKHSGIPLQIHFSGLDTGVRQCRRIFQRLDIYLSGEPALLRLIIFGAGGGSFFHQFLHNAFFICEMGHHAVLIA
ncbi:hypothetical protein SDC9_207451 [bioreactor metagenome]|uniref:Uncharacterized protein n=1 Tax=bioreactor metagenome TaxID=1076179 RepID=A0A645JAH8_9ZZZZ